MQVLAECIPCYFEQAIRAFDQAEVPKQEQTMLLNKLLDVVSGLDQSKSPAENSSYVMHKLVHLLEGKDPFKAAKAESNRLALALCPQLREDIVRAKDPLNTAIKFSVAGNIVDLGLFADYDLEQAVREAVQVDFAINDYHQLQLKLQKARCVMIVGDNSGEIVFDRLLVEEMKKRGLEVVYGVKGGFVINDATWDDAEAAGMLEVAKVITNGNNFLGTIVDKCSPEFISAFNDADVVISKGQANYESLEGSEFAGNKTFFILKAKCPCVANNLGVKYGDLVLAQNK